MTTTELAQEFAVTVRGYDRAQVDSYVETLREWLGNATLRMEAAEAQNGQLREQVVLLRTRVAHLEQQVSENPPRTIEALADRVSRILVLAEEGAVAVQADSEAQAVSILGRARREADDLIRTAQARHKEMEAFVAGAGQRATDLIEQAEIRADEAAKRLLAEAEARASSREAQAAAQARNVMAEALTERDHTLGQLAAEKMAIGAELRRLAGERDDVRDGLAKLRESLHRTIDELDGGASDNPSAPPPGQPAK